MLAFPGMLITHAKGVGMKVPDNADDYDKEEYPHFWVYCLGQLGRAIPYPEALGRNAEYVAGLSDEKIKTITAEELLANFI